MKISHLVLVSGLLFAAGNLFGQGSHPAKMTTLSLYAASHTNIDVIASGSWDEEAPCPPEYTNIISNTNLFTPEEQRFLNEIPVKYGNVTSNSGPAGSVLVSYRATLVSHYWGTEWLWLSRFQFTNSDLTDEVSPGGDLLRHVVRNKAGDGFDLNINPNEPRSSGFGGGSGPMYWFKQVKHGVKAGLSVEIVHGDHCSSWMQYSNGMAVDKWLGWDPNKPYLIIWAKFKQPCDIDKLFGW
jgi:hypothetical protein